MEATSLVVCLVAHIVHKGGDAYDIMGKIINAEDLFLIIGCFAELTKLPIFQKRLEGDRKW